MSLDFAPVENKFKEIRDLANFIDDLDFNKPSWRRLRAKLGSLKDQTDDIDIFIYQKFGNEKDAALPYGLEEEMYWRDLQTAYKMQALLTDYQKEHKIKI